MLSLRLDQGSVLNQGKTRLGQGMTMDWSGNGRWTGMRGKLIQGTGLPWRRQCWAQARARQGAAGLVQGAGLTTGG